MPACRPTRAGPLPTPHPTIAGAADGAAVQDALEKVTGRSTVPQVFVGGQHVGGCDDTLAAEASGELARLLEGAGLRPKAS